jgi:hypothetical protein
VVLLVVMYVSYSKQTVLLIYGAYITTIVQILRLVQSMASFRHTNDPLLVFALLNKGSSIHSPCQFEWYRNDVNDKSVFIPGGLQRIQTLDGYIIPLIIQDGLTHLKIRPYTDHKFDTSTIPSSFNDVGDCKHCIALQHHSYFQRQMVIQLMMSKVNVYLLLIHHLLFMSLTEILDAPTSSQTLTPKTTAPFLLAFY